MVTHTDLDGISCFILALYYQLNIDEYISINYDDREKPEIKQKLSEYDYILYTDFTPSIENLEEDIKSDAEVIILDHHISANKELIPYLKNNPERNITYIYDNNKCGTSIFLDYINDKFPNLSIQNNVKEYTRLVETYDLWREDLGENVFQEAADLNRVMGGMRRFDKDLDNISRYEWFIQNQIKKFNRSRNQFWYYEHEKNKILKAREREQEVLVQTKQSLMVRKDSKNRKFGLVCMRSKISMIAHFLLLEREDLDYIIIVNTWDKDNLRLSLRSKNMNLLKLENVSGHVHAAGLEWEQKDIGKLIRGSIVSIPYKHKVR